MSAIKNPTDRAHLWERPTPAHEQPAPAVDPDFPRHVHKAGGEWLEVGDEAALEAAQADGWQLQPVLAEPDMSAPTVAADVHQAALDKVAALEAELAAAKSAEPEPPVIPATE